MVRPTLRALLTGTRRRVLHAEASFFDSYCRGGCRDPRDLVIPIDFFVREPVEAILRAWLARERPLDLDGLCAAWRAAAPAAGPREERLFFKNLADFVALVGTGPPAPEPAPRARRWPAWRAPQPWEYGRRRQTRE